MTGVWIVAVVSWGGVLALLAGTTLGRLTIARLLLGASRVLLDMARWVREHA